jgi:tetraacyldisaccharide 4'-kinase
MPGGVASLADERCAAVSFSERLSSDWYARGLTGLTGALAPLTPLFTLGAAVRRALYRGGVLRVGRLPVPVVVVGNISVGGSGKTPLVIALASALARAGRHPGIVSRGYGRRRASAAPVLVTAATDPAISGDEPALLARAGFPVAVAPDRVAAGRALLAAYPECDVVIADDGLQHYALARDVEIAVVDGARGFGNGWRLPAGPLREAKDRLASVDAVVVQAAEGDPQWVALPNAYRMTLSGSTFHGVADPKCIAHRDAFDGEGVHAIAGIGNPARFFATLTALGIRPACHAFPDHHAFVAGDLAFPGARAILMTEKDAVKCAGFADTHCWYLPVTATIDPALVARVLEKLRGPQAA